MRNLPCSFSPSSPVALPTASLYLSFIVVHNFICTKNKKQITGYLNWTVRMGCETEARITSVERAKEYADLNPEAAPIVDGYRPPKVNGNPARLK